MRKGIIILPRSTESPVCKGVVRGLLAIIILGIIQVTLLDYFKIFGVKPDLLIIAVVLISQSSLKPRYIQFFSIFCGILKDILGLNSFGINTVLFTLWSLLIIRLSKKISIDNNFTRAMLVYIICVFNSIIMRLIFLTLGKFISWGIFFRLTFLESLYSALIAPLLFKIFVSINHSFDKS
jgi:rod shape-determining protein MreD